MWIDLTLYVINPLRFVGCSLALFHVVLTSIQRHWDVMDVRRTLKQRCTRVNIIFVSQEVNKDIFVRYKKIRESDPSLAWEKDAALLWIDPPEGLSSLDCVMVIKAWFPVYFLVLSRKIVEKGIHPKFFKHPPLPCPSKRRFVIHATMNVEKRQMDLLWMSKYEKFYCFHTI